MKDSTSTNKHFAGKTIKHYFCMENEGAIKQMKSSVESHRPELELLKRRVEEREGIKPAAPSDFLALTAHINDVIDGQLNEYTLMRLWGYLRQYKTIRHSTLDLLAKYVGHNSWNDFLSAERAKLQEESGLVARPSIHTQNLQAGDKVRIAWLPDRISTLLYKGNHLFEIIETENTSWSNGETFCCRTFIVGEPLYVDNLTHTDGSVDTCYCVGMQNGLTIAEVL